jgi:hypothetical protein
MALLHSGSGGMILTVMLERPSRGIDDLRAVGRAAAD